LAKPIRNPNIGDFDLTSNPIWKKNLICVFFITLMPSLCLGALDKPTKVPGTTIAMTPPSGYVLSDNFSGFENREDNSSITISELPKASYSELAVLFSSREAAAPFSAKGFQ
jgi:hypothetical protein